MFYLSPVLMGLTVLVSYDKSALYAQADVEVHSVQVRGAAAAACRQ